MKSKWNDKLEIRLQKALVAVQNFRSSHPDYPDYSNRNELAEGTRIYNDWFSLARQKDFSKTGIW